MEKLQKALNNLKKCHRDIRKEFSKVDDSVIREFLGELYSPELKQNMLKFGDGHVLYGVPSTIDKLTAVDVVVLIAMNSPRLDEDSDFNPFTPLHTIHDWRYKKRLKPQVRSAKSQKEYSLHFFSWQQDFAIHGKDNSHARKNRRLLLNTRPRFETLFQKEEEVSMSFICQLITWLDDNGKRLVVITN